jgi:hypothetical protein
MKKKTLNEQSGRKRHTGIAAGGSICLLNLAIGICPLPFPARAADAPLVVLGGEVGAADKASIIRFRSAPGG